MQMVLRTTDGRPYTKAPLHNGAIGGERAKGAGRTTDGRPYRNCRTSTATRVVNTLFVADDRWSPLQYKRRPQSAVIRHKRQPWEGIYTVKR